VAVDWGHVELQLSWHMRAYEGRDKANVVDVLLNVDVADEGVVDLDISLFRKESNLYTHDSRLLHQVPFDRGNAGPACHPVDV